MSVDQLVEARQNAMKQNGGLLRGAMRAKRRRRRRAANTMLQNFTNLPELFREGSTAANSKALPLIWENWDDFRARFDEDAKHAAEAVAAAQAGDAAALWHRAPGDRPERWQLPSDVSRLTEQKRTL